MNTNVWKCHHIFKYGKSTFFWKKHCTQLRVSFKVVELAYTLRKKKICSVNFTIQSPFNRNDVICQQDINLHQQVQKKPIQINTSTFRHFPSFILGSCFLTSACYSEQIVLTSSTNVLWASSDYKCYLNFKVVMCIVCICI